MKKVWFSSKLIQFKTIRGIILLLAFFSFMKIVNMSIIWLRSISSLTQHCKSQTASCYNIKMRRFDSQRSECQIFATILFCQITWAWHAAAVMISVNHLHYKETAYDALGLNVDKKSTFMLLCDKNIKNCV